MTPAQLLDRARKDRERLGLYGVSAFAGRTPSTTAAEVVSEATIPHRVIRATTVQRIRAAGFEIEWSFARPHCTIDLGLEPTEAKVVELMAAFDPPVPNPGLKAKMIRVEVDFNSRDEYGMVPAAYADADGPVRVGDLIETFDLEGYRCPGVVARLANDGIAIDPVWRAFAAPEEARIVLRRPIELMWPDWRNRLTLTLWPRQWPILEAHSQTGPADLALA
jgi:hypothetical protein